MPQSVGKYGARCLYPSAIKRVLRVVHPGPEAVATAVVVLVVLVLVVAFVVLVFMVFVLMVLVVLVAALAIHA